MVESVSKVLASVLGEDSALVIVVKSLLDAVKKLLLGLLGGNSPGTGDCDCNNNGNNPSCGLCELATQTNNNNMEATKLDISCLRGFADCWKATKAFVPVCYPPFSF